jgi:acetyltransferase-like isoleucine patch superfamily enzyme
MERNSSFEFKNPRKGTIGRFLSGPLPRKLNYFRGFTARLKSAMYYRRVLGHFGAGCVIYKTSRIMNPQCISVGDRTTIGVDASIEPILVYANVRYTPRIEIGKDVYIGPHLYMACVGRMTIGDGSVLSEYVSLNDSSHGFDPEAGLIMQQELEHPGDITIGKNCFLGLRSAVMPGVTLGDHCVVGTGAVVTKSFPAYSMLAGAPAVLIKRYSPESKKWVRVSDDSAS